MHQNGNEFYPRVAWVKFREEIKIGSGKNKRVIRAAEYKGENCSEKIFLVSQGNKIPETNKSYVVFLPVGKYPFIYRDNRSVFSVRTAEPKIINGVIVLKDNLMPRDIFKIKSPNRNKAIILIRDPSDIFKTFLFLIKMECRDNEEEVIRFIEKNLIDKEVKAGNGIIEVVIGISENPEYLTSGFLSNLSEYISYLSET